MDPIYLYADEIDGAYRITIGRTDEHVLTPAKNLLESPSEDLIDEIIYELQKSITGTRILSSPLLK